MLYTTFNVKDRDYKLRLNAKACVDLEKKLGTNPLNIFVNMFSEGDKVNLPTIGDIIIILHASLQAYEHNMTMDKVYELYDNYIAEGHTQIEMLPIIAEVFKVSGLIPEEAEIETKNA